MHEKIFSRIGMALALTGLIGTTISWLAEGFDSVWLLPSIGLMLIALAAGGVQLAGKFMAAAYTLTAGLTGLVAVLFWQGDTAASFTPYLFIPIVLFTGLIFGPLAPIFTVLGAMTATALVLIISRQFSLDYLQTLWVPFGLILIVALLTTELGRYIGSLRKLSTEKTRLLRHYIQKTEHTLQQARTLQQRITGLEHQLSQPQTATKEVTRITQKKNRLYALINGAIQELNSTVSELERIMEGLEELPKSVAQTDFIEEAWKKIYHLTNLVVSLEEIAKLENNQVTLQYRDVDIAAMIRDAIGTAQGLARNKDVTLRYQLPHSLPPIQADPLRLRQALLRLLSNAVKYTDEGLIEIETDVSDDFLTIRVSDTGIGINPDETDLIFDNFVRGSEAMSLHRGGPGLGLAISKRLVELHGGEIRVSSTPGIGSTFYVALPFTPPEPEDITDTLPAIREAVIPSLDDTATIPTIQPEIEFHAPLFAADLEPSPIRRRRKSSNLGPVARFGPTYVVRFGLALLSMLVVVSAIVAFLAFYNRPITSNAKTTGAALLDPPTATATDAGTPTAEQEQVVAAVPPTDTATPEPSSTYTPSPTMTPSPLPTASFTPTSLPTATAIPSATPTATSSPTPQPPATATLPPPTQTPLWPTPLATATPIPPLKPTETAVPIPPTPQTRRLSYLVSNGDGWHVEMRTVGNVDTPDMTIPINTANHNRANWSRQNRLVYAASQQGVYQIFTANADGSQPQQVIQSGSDDLQPVWSPTGEQILFSSGRTGNFELFRVNVDGSNLTQLTNERGFDEWPVWSPTGREIAFVSDRNGNEEIYIMNSDGSNVRQVTDHPADDWPAAWSPTGQQLVFGSNRDGNWNLFTVNVDGSGLQRLTNDPANEREPIWSADGSTIAFACDDSGSWDVYTTAASATETTRDNWTQLTNTPTDERYPTWLP